MEGRDETQEMEEGQNGEGREVCGEMRQEEQREARGRRKVLLLIGVNKIFTLLSHSSVWHLKFLCSIVCTETAIELGLSVIWVFRCFWRMSIQVPLARLINTQ